jgi:hypothetical protein
MHSLNQDAGRQTVTGTFADPAREVFTALVFLESNLSQFLGCSVARATLCLDRRFGTVSDRPVCRTLTNIDSAPDVVSRHLSKRICTRSRRTQMHRAQTICIRAKHAISARFFCSIYTSQRLYGTYTKFIGFIKILGKLNKLAKLVFMDRPPSWDRGREGNSYRKDRSTRGRHATAVARPRTTANPLRLGPPGGSGTPLAARSRCPTKFRGYLLGKDRRLRIRHRAFARSS